MAQPGYLTDLCGIKVFQNAFLTESEIYEEEVTKTWKERLLDPLRQFKFREFRPWVKTKMVSRTRQVPSKNAFVTNGMMYVHPEMYSEIVRQMGGSN